MKLSKSKLTYILLSVALVGCIAGVFVLGYGLFFDHSIKMTNLQNMDKKEVLKWVTKNKLENNIKYEYVYSEDIEEGKVVSQSLDPNTKIEGNFTVQISKGSIITLNISDYKNKDEFDKFISQYPNVKVTYDGKDLSGTSNITKFSKNTIDIKADVLIVYFEKEDEKDTIDITNEKDINDGKDDDKTGNTATIPTNLLGIKEDEFIKKLNDLGFKNLKKDTNKYYSFTSKADTIFSYEDGKYDVSRTIKYAISLGDYPTAFKASDYNGKTKAEADAVAKTYNDLNAHITLNTNNVETSDSNQVNKLGNCKCEKNGFKSIITCDLYSGKTETKTVASYSNKPESTFLSDLKALGFKNFNKTEERYSTIQAGYVISNDTGSKKTTETIKYITSLGPYYLNKSDFENKSLNDANNRKQQLINKGANITLNTSELLITDTDGKNNGFVYNCSQSGNTISCDLAVMTYSIPNSGFIKSLYTNSSSFEATKSDLMNNLFSEFNNVQYIGVTDAKGVGQIVSVKVNGNSDYSAGYYKSNTPIVVEICNNQLN